MRLPLSEISAILGTPPVPHVPLGGEAAGYSIDSRSVAKGDLFFAIQGPRFDGHDFIGSALEAGAVAVVASREWADAHADPERILPVGDPAEALRTLAREARRRWGRPVVGVTGSNGKTTTKDTISALLGARLCVSKSQGNLNNELGLPLSLLRIDDGAEIAVMEMGMNHRGEICRLAAIAEPTVGVVTNVSAAHLEYFASVDEIASAKRELIESLPPEGTAVLNADDERVRAFADVRGGPSRTFGFGEAADFRAVNVQILGARGAAFELRSRFSDERTRFESRLMGRHNILNVLAGIATASVFGVEPAALVGPVRALAPSRMRGEVLDIGGVLVLNDCYNANPLAMAAMLDVLGATEAKRRIAVLGEMRELGEGAEELHREVGRTVVTEGVDFLVGVTGHAEQMVQAAAESGLSKEQAAFFDKPEAAGEYLADLLRPGDAALFKASRGVELERALRIVEERLVAAAENTTGSTTGNRETNQ